MHDNKIEPLGQSFTGIHGDDALRAPNALSLSVVIVTWRRPTFVKRCLESLDQQDRRPEQVLVIDASEDDETKRVAAQFPTFDYIPFAGGAGHMTTARNEALLHATGDVIAFLDDDTRAHAGWARSLLARYEDCDVAALAGRTLNNVPGEGQEGIDSIGKLLPDGQLTGNFAAQPVSVTRIDHGIGANMSFRRSVLAELGGFRDYYPGTALREDSDIFLRVKALGGDVLFDPDVTVDHLPAPHVRGRRFGYRYSYYAARNHVQFLALNFGLSSRTTRMYLRGVVTSVLRMENHRSLTGRTIRVAIHLIGSLSGIACALRYRAIRPIALRRDDDVGRTIRQALRERR